jgi:hypothetical protein
MCFQVTGIAEPWKRRWYNCRHQALIASDLCSSLRPRLFSMLTQTAGYCWATDPQWAHVAIRHLFQAGRDRVLIP